MFEQPSMGIHFEAHRASMQASRHVLMGPACAHAELDTQDRNTARASDPPEKAPPANGNWQRRLMHLNGRGQRARGQPASDLGRGLALEVRMEMFVETRSPQRGHFVPDLSGRRQGERNHALLQPAVELVERPIAPRFVFGNEGQLDADHQGQRDEAIERTGRTGPPEQLAGVDLQYGGQPQPLPGVDDKRQHRFQLGVGLTLDLPGVVVAVAVHQKEPLAARPAQVPWPAQVQLRDGIAGRCSRARGVDRTGARLGANSRGSAPCRMHPSLDRAQRGHRGVAQTGQFVPDGRRTRQPVALTRALAPPQAVANLHNRLAYLGHPCRLNSMGRMRAVAQPATAFGQIPGPPFVKPLPAALDVGADGTDGPARVFEPNCLLPQPQFARHCTSSRRRM